MKIAPDVRALSIFYVNSLRYKGSHSRRTAAKATEGLGDRTGRGCFARTSGRPSRTNHCQGWRWVPARHSFTSKCSRWLSQLFKLSSTTSTTVNLSYGRISGGSVVCSTPAVSMYRRLEQRAAAEQALPGQSAPSALPAYSLDTVRRITLATVGCMAFFTRGGLYYTAVLHCYHFGYCWFELECLIIF